MTIAAIDFVHVSGAVTGAGTRTSARTGDDALGERYIGVKRWFYSGHKSVIGLSEFFQRVLTMKDAVRSRIVQRIKRRAVSKLRSHEKSRSVTGATREDGSRLGAPVNNQSRVDEKLSALTDKSGGLKYQMDTAKDFLELIDLGCRCVRDLSIVLEALLKTEDPRVMKGIIRNNGLQVFHNLLKQFREPFEKRPLLRKLLKVLDHLAEHKILRVEHICSPLQSIKGCLDDTLHELTRHNDLEVKRLAHNFRRLHVPPRTQWPDTNSHIHHAGQSSSLQMQSQVNQLLSTTKMDHLQESPIGSKTYPVQSDKPREPKLALCSSHTLPDSDIDPELLKHLNPW